MKISDIVIPDKLIAQYPCNERDKCRLLCLDRKLSAVEHRRFSDIYSVMDNGDLLVLNDTRVFKARIPAKKETGATIEILLLRRTENNAWHSIMSGRNISKGQIVYAGSDLSPVKVIEKFNDGTYVLGFEEGIDVLKFSESEGLLPLPPYIRRAADDVDAEYYQTVFAKNAGSAASPTAALHFTRELLMQLKSKGIGIEYVTLHVGYGTFSMIRDIDTHVMHREEYRVKSDLADRVQQCKANGNRVWAVGTTVVRALETVFEQDFACNSLEGVTGLFIKPGYEFKVVDALITNFHHPSTSLIYLVAAFAGIDNTVRAYKEAVDNRYRFLSYGDAMCVY
ncbi:MAG: tRNA preQ1(34) S-adenosylmethionine ribosyltransferase-isomerase QueA [Oligoflexia bacterium]|nr:tRNA preQ1(34) S-adenosylmethionine ribosyltransferase-isomerase QueA [Oligoflexia bacterium]